MQLNNAVRVGRKKEFASFNWQEEPDDPCVENTFLKSKLKWDKINNNKGSVLLAFYKKLIYMRSNHPVYCHKDMNKRIARVDRMKRALAITHSNREDGLCVVANFSKREISCKPINAAGRWRKILDSSDREWLGLGSTSPETIFKGSKLFVQPLNLIVYERKK
jgi:maltooligosyltrehalose trehalohydrolase